MATRIDAAVRLSKTDAAEAKIAGFLVVVLDL